MGKSAKQLFSEVEKKHQTMPFTLRALEDESKSRMGVKECVEHQLLDPYTVLYEKDSELVAQFKFTVLLMPNGPLRITGVGCSAGEGGKIEFDQDLFSSELSVENEEMKALLATSASRKATKKKKKKAVQQASDDVAAGGGHEAEEAVER